MPKECASPPLPLTECGTVAIQNIKGTLCLCQAPCMDTFKGLLHVFQVKDERSGTQWLTPVAWPRATDPSAGGHGWALSALAPVHSPFLDAFSSGRDFGWQRILCLTFSLKILSYLFYYRKYGQKILLKSQERGPPDVWPFPPWRKLWNDYPSNWIV